MQNLQSTFSPQCNTGISIEWMKKENVQVRGYSCVSRGRMLKKYSYRQLHPDTKAFSRYFNGAEGGIGASRIDRCYKWGNVTIVEAGYLSIAFSDHMVHVVKLTLPGLD